MPVIKCIQQNVYLVDFIINSILHCFDILKYLYLHICSYCKWKPKSELFIDFLEQQFIIQQLLLILRDYDLGDAASRQHLNKFITHFLQSEERLDIKVINMCIEILENSITNVDARCKFVCEVIISEILYPLNCEETAKKQKTASDLVC